jgi:DNA anti-recombination protein RmuC
MNDLNKKFKNFTTLKEKVEAHKKELEEDDNVEKFIDKYYKLIENEITKIKTKVDKIQTDFNKVMKYLGEDKYDIEKFIKLFKDFHDELKKSNDLYREKKNKKSKLGKI